MTDLSDLIETRRGITRVKLRPSLVFYEIRLVRDQIDYSRSCAFSDANALGGNLAFH